MLLVSARVQDVGQTRADAHAELEEPLVRASRSPGRPPQVENDAELAGALPAHDLAHERAGARALQGMHQARVLVDVMFAKTVEARSPALVVDPRLWLAAHDAREDAYRQANPRREV